MVATHSVVMETQRILQGATLSRMEALLDPEPPPGTRTRPAHRGPRRRSRP